MEIQKTILRICMEKGFLLDREMLNLLSSLEENSAKSIIDTLENLNVHERVITKALFSKNLEMIKKGVIDGKSKTIIESFFINLGYSRKEIEDIDGKGRSKEGGGCALGKVKVLTSPVNPPRKVSVKDFVNHFRVRYGSIRMIIEERGLENLTSIRKIGSGRGNYTIIAGVLSKRATKNKNLMLEVEDMTGSTVVLVNKNKKEVFDKAKDLLEDDIVAFSVSGNSEMLFANDVIFPDAFLQEKKRGKIDEWVAFISDVHAGSNMFLEENFLKFIKWINGVVGDDEQKEIAKKVKYLIINGDCVDGIGHFPGQDKWLNILDINNQYKKFSDLLRLIRKDIRIIISPGNHDAVWVGEPQPLLEEKYAPDLYKMDNVTLVTNPCLVEIDGDFRILMYHGASMHGIINEIEELRVKYKTDSPARIGKEILKRRHLAPTHGLVDYIPGEKEDALVIKYSPDILTTADLHRHEVAIYNNILLIATSCWQSITPFQEKVGNHPDFCKVPLFNLKTREVKILDFFDGEESEKSKCEEKGDVCELRQEVENENRN